MDFLIDLVNQKSTGKEETNSDSSGEENVLSNEKVGIKN